MSESNSSENGVPGDMPDDILAFLSRPMRENLEGELVSEDEVLDNIYTADVINVAMLTEVQLLLRYEEVKQELYDRREALNPTTDKGRELHSVRSACLIEMARRGLR